METTHIVSCDSSAERRANDKKKMTKSIPLSLTTRPVLHSQARIHLTSLPPGGNLVLVSKVARGILTLIAHTTDFLGETLTYFIHKIVLLSLDFVKTTEPQKPIFEGDLSLWLRNQVGCKCSSVREI